MSAAATGSDMGGSSRVPAAACGVFGLKPSYGLIPIDGRPNAFSENLHHITYGPITRTVDDAALLMEVMTGKHARDPASVPVEIEYRDAVNRSVDDLRVAYSPDLDVFPVEENVASVTEAVAFDAIGDAGATVEGVQVDHGLSMADFETTLRTTGGWSTHYSAEVTEHAMELSLLDHLEHLSASVRTLLEIGEELTRAEKVRADLIRTQFYDAVEDLFEEYDVLVTPTNATPGLEASPDTTVADRADQVLTYPFNWTGHPAASVPAGLTDEGLPVGLQVIAPRYDDDIVFAVSAAIERERPWHEDYHE